MRSKRGQKNCFPKQISFEENFLFHAKLFHASVINQPFFFTSSVRPHLLLIAHTHTLPLLLTHAHSYKYTHTLSLLLILYLTYSHMHFLTNTHAHTLSYTHTHFYTNTHTPNNTSRPPAHVKPKLLVISQ
jgi:hypothetical protein